MQGPEQNQSSISCLWETQAPGLPKQELISLHKNLCVSSPTHRNTHTQITPYTQEHTHTRTHTHIRPYTHTQIKPYTQENTQTTGVQKHAYISGAQCGTKRK